MEKIDALFEKLNQNQNVNEIRVDIVDLIMECLNEIRSNFGNWEKIHLANAIALLAQNIYSTHQPSNAWLRASLVYVEKSFLPPDQRSECFGQRENPFDSLTFDQLVADIQKLGGEVSFSPRRAQ